MADEIRRDSSQAGESGLIGCALRPADSGGRAHAEAEHPYRSCYQRDRDRIVHCSAFRRLDYKTQVFVPHEQDHYRTRLTHTLEVAQIARTLSRALQVNEDAAEAVALAHDLGHPPFGHAGEAALDELMADHGRFEHNRQSLRIVDYLEHPYPGFRGLNLTRAVRVGLARHETRYDAPGPTGFDDAPLAPLEGQLVDLSDEIAYTSSDLQDALAAGWITLDQLGRSALWRRAWQQAESAMPSARPIHKRLDACRNVLAIMADDVIAETLRRIAEMDLASPADVRRAPRRCAGFGSELAPQVEQLGQLLRERVYRHPTALQQEAEARRILRELFHTYLGDPSLLPGRYQSRIDEQGPQRVVCDYVAGMTDRFCRKEHARLTGSTPRLNHPRDDAGRRTGAKPRRHP